MMKQVTELEFRNEAQCMRQFFARDDVKALQEIQKRNPYGSEAHRGAFNALWTLADEINASRWIGEY